MIHANELRIGNFIRCLDIEDETWCVDKVALLTASQIITEDETRGGAPANEKYEGLPLTEEWLLKFGFTKDGNYTYKISISPLREIYCFPERELIELADNGDSFLVKKFKFVHQLQNLYFALTGKELTVKQGMTV